MKAPENIFRSLRRHYEAQPSIESFGQSFAFPNSAFRLSAVFTGAVQGEEVQSPSSPAPAEATVTATTAAAPATAAATPGEHSTKRRGSRQRADWAVRCGHPAAPRPEHAHPQPPAALPARP